MNVSGQTVLITGASGGLGQAIARRMREAGAIVRITARRTEILDALAGEIGATAIAADLSDRADVARLAEASKDVDILVANAALPGSGALDGFSPDQIDRALEVNLRAPIILSRLLAPEMQARGRGQIVLMSSLLGKTSSPGSSIYCATKFGLRGFGQALRADLRGTGVGVSVIFPGFVSEAGMFHESGTKLPSYIKTITPGACADAVIGAIEHDRGEVDVAPATLRVGVKFSEIAPAIAARVSDRLGARKIADQMSSGQSKKR
ncbi:unannotated protein [freshwater metagenome]|uniref:Unannotated protein n=1 Tax=freshwater metagenome TaxID=449393 RepID=A0A6J7DDX9_9ZZZZ|nr:SDR family NAD(P)-dependent oxidoreductase [Actinomycetota bacterium]